MSVLVLDATVLSHFARTGNLDVLESLLAGHRCAMPAEVARELAGAIPDHPALARAIDLHWVETVELDGLAEIMAFAKYKTEFGGGTERNNGEAAVLAYAAVHGGIAIVDERAATRAARRDGIDVHGTLWLITNAVRTGKLNQSMAERLVDDLAASGMRLPVDGAGLFAWAYAEGLLP